MAFTPIEDSSKWIAPGSCSASARIIGKSVASSFRVASRNPSAHPLFPPLLDEFRHQAAPPRLMARTDPRTIIAVEVFVEENQVAPMWIALKRLCFAPHRAAARTIAQKNVRQPPRNLRGHLPEIGLPARVRRAGHLEVLSVVVVELLQRFHQQVIDGKPDGAPPV